jgi:hypothetical protein
MIRSAWNEMIGPSLKKLDLNAELIRRDSRFLFAAAERDYALAFRIEEPEQRRRALVISAANYRRAGANYLLDDDRMLASAAFELSAQAYFEARVAGKNYGSEWFLEESPQQRVHLPHQIVYPLLVSAARQADPDRIIARAHEAALPHSTPLGVLRIPLGDYLDLTIALATGEGIRQALAPFLEAYNRAILRARSDIARRTHGIAPSSDAAIILSGFLAEY